MQGKLTDADGQTVEASLDAVRERLSGEAFFWLDLEGLDADSSELLLRGFAFHPLAVEDAEHFAIWMLNHFSHQGETCLVAPGNGFYANGFKEK